MEGLRVKALAPPCGSVVETLEEGGGMRITRAVSLRLTFLQDWTLRRDEEGVSEKGFGAEKHGSAPGP